jgi:hypothetical protein
MTGVTRLGIFKLTTISHICCFLCELETVSVTRTLISHLPSERLQTQFNSEWPDEYSEIEKCKLCNTHPAPPHDTWWSGGEKPRQIYTFTTNYPAVFLANVRD